MSDETETAERHAEQQAEDQWAAEYVDPYRGVPLPPAAFWQDPNDWSDQARRAWRTGVDAALELHADLIKKCNAALQQVTGGSRPDGMVAAGVLREYEHEIASLADLLDQAQVLGTDQGRIIGHVLHRLDEMAGMPFPRGAAVLPALPLPPIRVTFAEQPSEINYLKDGSIDPPIRFATVLPDVTEALGLPAAQVAVHWDHHEPGTVSIQQRVQLTKINETGGQLGWEHP